MAVSTDGRYVAAGGGDAAVHVWDARSNKHIKSLRSHKVGTLRPQFPVNHAMVLHVGDGVMLRVT